MINKGRDLKQIKSNRLEMVLPRKMLILILFTCALFCRVSCQERPVLINQEGNEIIKNAGDPIYFSCKGYKKIVFYYPTNYGSDDEHSRKVISSSVELSEETNRIGESIYHFSRRKSVPGDTGWYGCSYRNKTITEEDYDDPEFNWVYVYVDSPNSSFVESVIETIKAVAGSTILIPCRPTLPSLNVILFGQDDEPIEIDDQDISYDPKFGYKKKDVNLHDSGIYTCVIMRDGEKYDSHYHLDVFLNQNVNQPIIKTDTLRHVIYGQTLRVNCTIELQEKLLPFTFEWKLPNNNKRITQHQEMFRKKPNLLYVTKELVIQNVMEEDEGEYECAIRIHGSSNSAKMNLTIYDPNEKYINLTAQDLSRHYNKTENTNAIYVVYYDAYPEVQLKWWKNMKEEITDDWSKFDETKYTINRTSTTIILRINRLKHSDSGTYTLVASNEHANKSLNFSLLVLVKPSLFLNSTEMYYSYGKISDIQSHVEACPDPDIYWSFLQCPNYPSEMNSSLIKLNYKTEKKQGYFLSKASMKIEMSGKINCTACNILGCETVVSDIVVTDGANGFGIIEPKRPIVESDDIEIACTASIYNYTNNIRWLDKNQKEILENERIKITYDKTLFTYRAILQIKNVHLNDSMIYYCMGESKDGNSSFEYELSVEKQEKPSFRFINLNETDLVIDFGKENHKLTILKCHVNGMPKPKVTWYKDNVRLKNSEQYEYEKDNQELYIKFFFEYDSGKYSCRAENRLGSIEAYQNILIMGKELPKGLIILIVILLIILIILILYFTIKFRREKKMRKELLETGLMHFEEGALECLNPELTVDDQAELLPYDKKWEFPRERLKLGKQLGSGAFGVVMKAEAHGITDVETVTTVAVKMVRRTTDPTYVRALASELKIMVHLGKHLNVVNLLGACTKNIFKRELLVIVEYCRFGNLHNFLLRHRTDFINQIDPSTGKFDPTIGIDILTKTASISSNNSTSVSSGSEMMHYYASNTSDSQDMSMSPDGCILSNNSSQPGWRSNYRGDYKDHNLKPICTQDLLSWAFQVARGMEYLSQRKVLHGDLAARNILLAENNVVKICDFGLAKTMYKDGDYKKKGDGPLPIKWMAIESIRDRVFSTQSDIWSFGIVLWEFFTLAKTPYPGMEAEIQYQKLIEGYRMEKPEYATQDIYNIMLQCWKAKPTLRPGFTELVGSIGDLLEESVKTHYITLNTPYMDMNTMILDGKNDYLTMMSAPDHTVLSLPIRDYVNSPVSENPPDSAYLCMSPSNNGDESGIFSPKMDSEKLHFEFPSVTSDTEDAELSPMLKKVDDYYLKPINVHERRAEFARKRQVANVKPIERISSDSGYCNAPQNLHLIDLNDKLTENDQIYEEKENEGKENEEKEEQEKSGNDRTDFIPKKKEYTPSIIRTQDNYVNMPKQKNDLRRDTPDSFSNPSYIIMGKEFNHTTV